MKRIVDINEAHFCDGLSCYDCSLWDLDNQKCKVLMWIDEQPEFNEKEIKETVESISPLIEKIIEQLPNIVESVIAKMPDAIEEYLKKKGGEEV